MFVYKYHIKKIHVLSGWLQRNCKNQIVWLALYNFAEKAIYELVESPEFKNGETGKCIQSDYY